MKSQASILTIFILFMSLSIYGQEQAKDTVFIQKDSLLGTAQSIFFDNNRNSQFYDVINYWGFLEFDHESYSNSIDFLKEKKIIFSKEKPVIPYTNWITLKQYKGEFYAYHPCDFYSHFKASINDSTYIDWSGEGPIANKILAQKKIDEHTYEFDLLGIYEKERKLRIHIIDGKKGIAVFEEITNGTDNYYYLMIAAEQLKSVPLIVNNCELEKQFELQFEEPNFLELLKSK